MEVLKSGDSPALISNIEVMNLLRERAAKRAPDINDASDKSNIKLGPFQNRDWIETSVLSYLETSSCGGSDVKLDDMPELVERLQREPNSSTATDGYGLTNMETLQVLNHLPASPVELHLLIEDLENRPGFVGDSFKRGEEKQTEFLKLISKYSGKEVTAVDSQDREDDMEEE
ncbi:hypothetical protein ACHAWO_007129 [Cyclotella atomus]|jgi:hypothetical protein|uniref:DNA-directed RNA polymerase III subunit RPC9 n=1 Tax=Cyclotella atomus TaxID=382360 RepID=A0ABD3PS74_9STRA